MTVVTKERGDANDTSLCVTCLSTKSFFFLNVTPLPLPSSSSSSSSFVVPLSCRDEDGVVVVVLLVLLFSFNFFSRARFSLTESTVFILRSSSARSLLAGALGGVDGSRLAMIV